MAFVARYVVLGHEAVSGDGIVVGGRVGPPLEGILADFSIDSATLKPKHKQWLDLNVTWKIRRGGGNKAHAASWRIHLYGLASHSGSDSHNLALSKHRAESVRAYILHTNPGARVEIEIFPRGEAYADTWQGALDRAVHLQMWQTRPGQKPPPPLEIPQKPNQESPWLEPGPMQSFRICTEDFITGGLGFVGRLKMWMVVEEPLRKKHCYYLFTGNAVGVSLGLPGDINQSDPFSDPRGEWNPFQARGFKTMPLTTADFGGPASYNKLIIGSNNFRFGMSDHGHLAYIPDFKSPDDGIATVDVATTIQGEMKALCEELPSSEFRSFSGRVYA